MTSAWIGIGGNIGDAVEAVRTAIDALGNTEGVSLEARSSLYRTAPRDYDDQADFINAVVRVDTALNPLELLDTLQALERRQGRRREGARFGPRRIDLDLLMYDDVQVKSPRLELPHPRMHERRFVLEPLVEIDPGAVVPGHGRADALLARCSNQRVDRLDAPGE